MARTGIRTGFLWLALCALALLASLAVVRAVHAQDSEEFAFRVAARLHPNGSQLEFGIQRIDDTGRPRGLHLEYHRFVDLNTNHHRWLYGDSSFLRQAPSYDVGDLRSNNGARVRVVARLHPTRGLFQFGAQYELDDTQLPNSDHDAYAPIVFDRKQFFPNNIAHHRWLYSGEIRFTRVWSGDGTMDEESTMEDDGSESGSPPASSSYTIESCLIAYAPGTEAMFPHDECNDLMTLYCEDDPDHASCVRWREQQ